MYTKKVPKIENATPANFDRPFTKEKENQQIDKKLKVLRLQNVLGQCKLVCFEISSETGLVGEFLIFKFIIKLSFECFLSSCQVFAVDNFVLTREQIFIVGERDTPEYTCTQNSQVVHLPCCVDRLLLVLTVIDGVVAALELIS